MTYSTTQAGVTEAQLVNKVFMALTAIFPAWKMAIAKQHDMQAATAQWTSAYRQQLLAEMKAQNINSDVMIDRGIAKARSKASQWLPSPGEFCQWCKPTAQSLGLKSAYAAWLEACEMAGKAIELRNWSHPIVYLSAHNVGFYHLKAAGATSNNRDRELQQQFTEKYDSYIQRVIDGETFYVPDSNRIGRDAGKHSGKNSKTASSALANIKSMFEG